MSKMNFAIALKMTTDQFKRGADAVKKGLLSIQYQAIGMASALGLGGIGLKNMVSRFIDVARETTRARVALKNISGDTTTYSKNLQFLTKLSGKYGQEINGMTSEFSKFSAAATSAGVSLSDQHEIFSSFTRSIAAFGMSSEDAKFSYMALSQMMSKGKVSSEELRRQLGERMPIAMEAMARATGVTIQGLDDLLKKGAVLSKDVMLPFVKEMEKMTSSVDVDNVETSLNRLGNTFVQLTQKLKVGDLYKRIIDGAASMLETLQVSFARVVTVIATSLIGGKLLGAFRGLTAEAKKQNEAILADKVKTEEQAQLLTQKRIAAEKRYNDTLVLYNKASDDEKLRSYSKLTAAESAMDRARQNEKAGKIAMNLAEEKAAAIQTQTIWTIAWTKIGSFIKGVLISIRGLFSTLIPMALIGLATNFIMKLRETRKEADRIKNIFSEYKKELSAVSGGAEAAKLQSLLKIVNDRYGIQKDINEAQDQLMGLLGVEKGAQVDLNKLVAKRVELLKNAAQADAYAQKIVSVEESNSGILGKTKLTEEQMKSIVNAQRGYNFNIGAGVDKKEAWYQYFNSVKGIAGIKGNIFQVNKRFKEIDSAAAEFHANLRVSADASNRLGEVMTQTVGLSGTTTTGGGSTGGGGSSAPSLTELQKVEQQYKDELLKINNLHAAGVTKEDEKNKAIDELNKTIWAEIGAIEGANAGLNETFIKARQGVDNPLYREPGKTVTLPTEGMRDTTFDYKKDGLQQLEELRDIKAEYVTALKGISEDEFSGIGGLIDAEASKLKDIDDLINAGRIKKDISELSSEIRDNLFDGLQNVYGLAKNLGNAFLNIKDTFADSDATFFERLISVFDALFATINGVMGVMQTIEKISTLTDTLSQAKAAAAGTEIASIGAIAGAKVAADTTETTSALAKSAAVVTALSAEEAAATGVMAAKSAAAYASIPFAGVGLAAGQIAAMQALITGAKALSALPGFAEGGIVPGSSFTGDKLVGRLNSGEMILNKSQQSNLWKAAQGRIAPTSQQGSPQNLKFEIEGKNLVAIFDQYATRNKRH